MFAPYRKLVIAVLALALNVALIWVPTLVVSDAQLAQAADAIVTIANVVAGYLVYRVPNAPAPAA